MPIETKQKILESCTLPVLTYGAQTWAATQAQTYSLAKTRIIVERALTGVKRREKVRNWEIQNFMGIKDCRMVIKKLNYDYAGHTCR